MTPLRLKTYKAVPGRYYGTPKEGWGFRVGPVRDGLVAAARRFLRANAETLGLTGLLGRLRLRRVVESVGARHVILQQHHQALRIHRAYVTVHIGRDRCIYLAKNRADLPGAGNRTGRVSPMEPGRGPGCLAPTTLTPGGDRRCSSTRIPGRR